MTETQQHRVFVHVVESQSADRCDGGPAYFLEIIPGAFAMLCTTATNMVAGDTCDVTIVESKPEANAITITLANV